MLSLFLSIQFSIDAFLIVHWHFSFPPAMPITFAFFIDAICPTIDPTAPDAADTKTTSSYRNCAGPRSAEYAVKPGIPSMPSAVVIGADPVFT